MEREKILVLGSTGMIGGYLMPVLARTGMPLVGTYASHAPEGDETASKHADPELIHFDYLVEDPAELIGRVRPKLVINLLHGTSEALRTCTMRLVELVAHEQIRYVFMSSSMAFDADLSHEHYEKMGISPISSR